MYLKLICLSSNKKNVIQPKHEKKMQTVDFFLPFFKREFAASKRGQRHESLHKPGSRSMLHTCLQIATVLVRLHLCKALPNLCCLPM